jgi:hypothetical protein
VMRALDAVRPSTKGCSAGRADTTGEEGTG